MLSKTQEISITKIAFTLPVNFPWAICGRANLKALEGLAVTPVPVIDDVGTHCISLETELSIYERISGKKLH
ncbi:MAG: hypothetical protein ACI8Y7_001004 [Candidatus Woesearchaeota archaeon]|jgi:hypothetical protein